MNANARLNKIDKILTKGMDPGKLYYPIWPENDGVHADKNGIPPSIYGGLSVSKGDTPHKQNL